MRLGEVGALRHANNLVQELVNVLRPDRLHVAAWRGDRAQVTDQFAAVCDAVSSVPVPVAFEFMAYNAVPGFTLAVDVAADTGALNAAVVLDLLHFFRADTMFDELTARALRRVAVIQLSDIVERPRGDAVDEARHRRTFPGEEPSTR